MIEYKGIDYGRGKTNVDKETGIRYGVINQNEVLQAWADSSEPYYLCKGCVESSDEDEPREDAECDGCVPLSWYIDDKEYQADCGESGDIFIYKSPYYTLAQLCSPCAPGACYLMSPCTAGEKAYCFGHDWFDDEQTPYPVYRVSDNKQVLGDKT